MELFKNTDFDFLGKKWPFIIASLVLTAAGFVSLAMKGGPRYGIDFKGGALVYVKFADKPPIEKIRSALSSKIPLDNVQEVAGTNEVIVSTEIQGEQALDSAQKTMIDTFASTFGKPGSQLDINNASQFTLADRLRDPLQRAGSVLTEQQLQELVAGILRFKNTPPQSGLLRSIDQLSGAPGVTPQVLSVLKQETYAAPYTIRNKEMVGPKIGADLRHQAVMATLYALGAMLVYIAFRFEWIYGVAAVVAVFHDTLLTIGLFSLFNKELSLTVVAALLTLVGYSMNDTIVVFDRIRENLKILRRERLDTVINKSVNQTLSRTILTSGLTLLTALSLFLFGGPVLNGFAFALVVGIIVGTYSSIFIASPILVFWQNFVEKRKGSVVGSPATAPARRTAK
jgi:preprotein translocase subunit SecF